MSKQLQRIGFLGMVFLFIAGGSTASAGEQKQETDNRERRPEQTWGAAAGLRTAANIFNTDDGVVNNVVTLLYFQGERFYLDGLEAGYKVYEKSSWQASLLARLRFFDVPDQYQNIVPGDTADVGGRLRYLFTENNHADLEILTDQYGNLSSNFTLAHDYVSGGLELSPFFTARLKSSGFNSRYYGLEWLGYPAIDGGLDFQVGVELKYHLISNIYLLGSLNARWLDSAARGAAPVDSDWESAVFAGIGVFNEDRKTRKPDTGLLPYLRLAHGWGTYSSLGELFTEGFQQDEDGAQMTSVFYGYPVSDTLFSLPIEVYLTSGVGHHYSNDVQQSALEFVVAMKGYYTIPLPIRFRLGLAEGLSFVTEVPNIEKEKNEHGGYDTSRLMNYLDISVDCNVGDLFRSRQLENLWLGVAIHHRSAMFEGSQFFNRISGGSNYPSLYLQYHF